MKYTDFQYIKSSLINVYSYVTTMQIRKIKHFCHLKKFTSASFQSNPTSITNHCSDFYYYILVLPLIEFHMNRIIPYVPFHIVLGFSLNIMFF